MNDPSSGASGASAPTSTLSLVEQTPADLFDATSQVGREDARMSQPEYDGKDMNDYYEFQEYRECRKKLETFSGRR